jgi:hypothetical protein
MLIEENGGGLRLTTAPASRSSDTPDDLVSKMTEFVAKGQTR